VQEGQIRVFKTVTGFVTGGEGFWLGKMEVSWTGDEEELMFACESPSPQPKPDLQVDFSLTEDEEDHRRDFLTISPVTT